jgi:hypothetical protein
VLDKNHNVKHYLEQLEGTCALCARRTDVITCEVYPAGIPEPLLYGEVKHTSSYPGDEGVLFKRVKFKNEK